MGIYKSSQVPQYLEVCERELFEIILQSFLRTLRRSDYCPPNLRNAYLDVCRSCGIQRHVRIEFNLL